MEVFLVEEVALPDLVEDRLLASMSNISSNLRWVPTETNNLTSLHVISQDKASNTFHLNNFSNSNSNNRLRLISVNVHLPTRVRAMQSPVSPTSTRGINPQQGPFYPQTQRRLSDAHHNQPATPTSAHQQQPPSLSDLGKGLPLHAVPNNWPLYIVEFKAGRTDLFYATDPQLAADLRVGDLVVVEADRGKDLGKIVNDRITISEVEAFQRDRDNAAGHGSGLDANGQPVSPGGGPSGGSSKKEINPKMIYGKANQQDVHLLATKTQDELKALQLCQTKVRAKKLPMEVIDAEYQWDRRKLTFYFIAEKRIDFRELVRELFRLYKTRIWMASLQGGGGFEQ